MENIMVRYGVPFPQFPSRPLPPKPELPRPVIIDGLAQAMRAEHYRLYEPGRTMSPWKPLSEERKAPWRTNAEVAIKFLSGSR